MSDETTTAGGDEGTAEGSVAAGEETETTTPEGQKGEEKKQEKDAGKEGEGDKSSKDSESKTGAAKDFEPKLPEGVTSDEKLLTSYKAFVKETGIPHDAAQKALEFYAKAQQETEAANLEGWKAQKATWEQELQKDKEFGGEKYKSNVAAVRGLLKQYAGSDLEALRKTLNDTGLGNHPALVRTLGRIAAANADDSIAGAHGSNGASQPSEREVIAQRYDKTPGMNGA